MELIYLAILCQIRVGPKEEIRDLAQSFQKQAKLSAKDAIHLACASYVGANIFLSCDDDLIRQIRTLKIDLTAMNPVDYIRREGD